MGQPPASPARPSVKPLPGDGFVYSGNPHDCVPRALLLDRRLTPLERNTWQVIRLLLQGDGITTLPTTNICAPTWPPAPARYKLPARPSLVR